MKKTLILLYTCILSLEAFAQSQRFASNEFKDFSSLEKHFKQDSIPRFETGKKLLISYNYGSADLNKNDVSKLDSAQMEFTEVTMLISAYPKNREKWINSFSSLSAQRLKNLFALAPYLNSEKINYKILWQTDCETEQEAQQLFHGFAISYKSKKQPNAGRSLADKIHYDSFEVVKGKVYSDDNNCKTIFVITTSFVEYNKELWLCNPELGAFSTSDYGETVKERNKGFPTNVGIQSLCVFKGKLYCTDVRQGVSVYNESTGSWQQVKGISADNMAWKLETNGEVMVVNFQEDGIYITNDGTNWKKVRVMVKKGGVLTEGTKVSGAASFYFRGRFLYLSNGTKLFYTANYGETWFQSHLPFEKDIFAIKSLNGDDSKLLLSAVTHGIYYTEDNGRKWVNMDPEKKYPALTQIYSGAGYFLMGSHMYNPGFVGYKDGKLFNFAPILGYSIYRYGDYIFVGSNAGMIYRFEVKDIEGKLNK